MTKNQAAWITEAKSRPLKVDEASNWKAGAGEVLIKNVAVAIVCFVSPAPTHQY